MSKIEKLNGYVYLVEGAKGFETYYRLGKDPDELEKEIVEDKPKKANKKKKSED